MSNRHINSNPAIPLPRIKVFKSEYPETLERDYQKWMDQHHASVVRREFAVSDSTMALCVYYEVHPDKIAR